MVRFLIAAVSTGLLFGILDGIINANPFAVKLMECYKPIAKEGINIPAGLVIDLLYGFAISGIYLLIMPVLPTESALLRGIFFGIGIWFFRVLMSVISSWMMFKIPGKTLIYIALAGLLEMILLGILNGLIIRK